MALNKNILSQAATEARGLAMDAVAACHSGHLGLPLGAAEIGAVLYGWALNVHPERPDWINRDRFVLSAGHGSMFLYSWLHLAGYNVTLEDVKNFRVLHSRTPGHPEFGETAGVECTTGPLGQGIGNAVGMAVSAKMAAARFNTDEHSIFDHKVVCLAGDGCIQEGVSAEASAFAGHFGLDNLILIYDSNDVTLDAMADASQTEDTEMRYKAYGFDVETVNGNDMDAFAAAYGRAYSAQNGRPKLIIARTLIGKGIPEVEGTEKAHGEGGMKFVEAARRALGLPDERFYVSEDTRNYFEGHRVVLQERYALWEKTFKAWKAANPEQAALLESGFKGEVPTDLLDSIPEFAPDKAMATRASGGKVLNAIAAKMPFVISGSADLYGSTKNYIDGVGDFTRDNPAGRNIRFGIREHAMGAIMNGIGYYGLFCVSGATFLTFSDYMRPSVRLAGLTKLPVFYIWTHDSVAVGQDGPTHQPVETTSSLRLIPNLDVIRPADAEETAGAFYAAVERRDGPTALILSRQDLPTLSQIPVKTRREGALKGGYVALKETATLDTILIATGSELSLALDAAKILGAGTRVVSMPSMERFERQSADYRETVLPATCRKRVAIEAGVSALWWKYVGSEGKVVGIDRFGLSAAGEIVLEQLGISVDNLVKTAQTL